MIIPEGFVKGWLTSILIRETDGSTGFTCQGLVEKIINLFSGNDDEIIQQITTLEFKIEKREDLFGRGHSYEKININNKFPKYLIENKAKYKNYIIE